MQTFAKCGCFAAVIRRTVTQDQPNFFDYYDLHEKRSIAQNPAPENLFFRFFLLFDRHRLGKVCSVAFSDLFNVFIE